jgi:hypothetical protein
MPDYFWNAAPPEPTERFPSWAVGADVWRRLGPELPLTFPRLLSELMLQRAKAKPGKAPLGCPRLFVSHRRADGKRARRVAKLASRLGFQVWLDVLEPKLKMRTRLTGEKKAMAIATIIETALCNSTHVIVLMTRNTEGSRWVGYEYGRVKDSSVRALNAACWIDPRLSPPLPEYLLLGQRTRTDAEIEAWLRGELAAWRKAYKRACPPPRMNSGSKPTGRVESPAARKQRFDEEFRAGNRKPLSAMRPIKFTR